MALFQDEPDEDSSPNAFQTEGEDKAFFPFQDEADEEDLRRRIASAPSKQPRASRVLGNEPDEVMQQHQAQPQLFGEEVDEDCISGSDDSAYFADCEDDCSNEARQLVQQVQLNFSTLNMFLSTQLGFPKTDSTDPPRKKRAYDNSKRAARAKETKRQKTDLSKRTVLARNNPDP